MSAISTVLIIHALVSGAHHINHPVNESLLPVFDLKASLSTTVVTGSFHVNGDAGGTNGDPPDWPLGKPKVYWTASDLPALESNFASGWTEASSITFTLKNDTSDPARDIIEFTANVGSAAKCLAVTLEGFVNRHEVDPMLAKKGQKPSKQTSIAACKIGDPGTAISAPNAIVPITLHRRHTPAFLNQTPVPKLKIEIIELNESWTHWMPFANVNARPKIYTHDKNKATINDAGWVSKPQSEDAFATLIALPKQREVNVLFDADLTVGSTVKEAKTVMFMSRDRTIMTVGTTDLAFEQFSGIIRKI